MSGVTLAAAILCGGLGTRLRPLTESIPKALAPVRGEPFLAHQLRLLRARGITRVVLCTGFLGEKIRDFAGDGRRFGLSIEYSSDWPALQGTAGAIREALPLLGDRFFVLYGDSYLTADYAAVERAFLASRRRSLMTVFRNEGRWDTSNVEYSGGVIRAYDKKNPTPRMHHIDYGLGTFDRQVFAALGPGPHDLADVYRELLERGELAACEVAERFYEVGSEAGIRGLVASLPKPGWV